MSNIALTHDQYTISNALLWGNCSAHAKRSCSGSLGGRVVHVIIAAVELIPLIGQIVSLFEMFLGTHFYTDRLERNESLTLPSKESIKKEPSNPCSNSSKESENTALEPDSKEKEKLELTKKINLLKSNFMKSLSEMNTEYDSQIKLIEDELSNKSRENENRVAEIKKEMKELEDNSDEKVNLEIELIEIQSGFQELNRRLNILKMQFKNQKENLISNFKFSIFSHTTIAIHDSGNLDDFLHQLSLKFPETIHKQPQG